MIHVINGAVDLDRPFLLFDNLLARGTLTASSGQALNAVSGYTFDLWAPQSGAASMEVQLSAVAAADVVAVFAHSLGSASTTVSLDRWNGGWVEIAEATAANDQPFAMVFPDAFSDRWRLRLNSATGEPVVGVAMLGRRLVVPGYVAAPYVPSWASNRIGVLGGLSRGGQFLGQRIQRTGGAFSVDFTPLERDWVAGDFRAFLKHYDEAKPFAFASSPWEFPEDLAYCWRTGGEIRPAFRPDSDYMSVRLEVECHVEP